MGTLMDESGLVFERLSKDNLKIAGKIQYEIFRDVGLCGYSDFVNEVEGKSELCENYLAKFRGTPIGIVGLNKIEKYPDDIFLGWLGVLPEFRGRGFGKRLFEFGLEIAKKTGRSCLRAYTFPKEVNGGGRAVPLYRKYAVFEEAYTNSKDKFALGKHEISIFTFKLNAKRAKKWNNRFVDVSADLALNERSLRKMKADALL